MLESTRHWKREEVVKIPFPIVMMALQNKYPNPYNENVISTDILDREIDQKTGLLTTTRLLNSTWTSFAHLGDLKAIESSVLDPKRQTFEVKSRNIDLENIMKANETLLYSVHPDNPEWTFLKHSISVCAFPFISYTAISFASHTAGFALPSIQWVTDYRLPLIYKNFESLKDSFSNRRFILPNPKSPNEISSLAPPFNISEHSLIDWGSDWLNRNKNNFRRDFSRIIRRCERVAALFSRIDEYVIIM